MIDMVIKVDEGKWYIYTPEGDKFDYSVENVARALDDYTPM